MNAKRIAPIYQVAYIIIPTIGTIGNFLIVYVTIRSKSLRSTCNVLIALISVSDIMQMFGLFVMMVTYYTIPTHVMPQADCACWQLIPSCGMLLSTIWILNLAIDRLMSLQRIYTMLVQNYTKEYIAMHIMPAVVISMGFGIWMFIERTEKVDILCEITAPMTGDIYLVITKFVIVINVLIILCYALFLYFMKKATSSTSSK
uniref:G_PROTEIN_RECEP_F1_2 domain-containing protein n=1 Tax=Haemonchus contortus TaxID=6289 RepID=A0A7I4YPL5_HAECO